MTSAFSSLRLPNYRLFLVGQTLSLVGTWVQRVAQDWLVLSLTHNSGTALGFVTAMQFLPMLLLTVWAGVLADRHQKRFILMFSQSGMCATALALGALTLTGRVHIWHVLLLALALGLFTSIDNPTRQAFIVELVGAERLSSAVGLNSATWNLARMSGPALGGVAFGLVGAGWAFMLNGASFVIVLVALFLMKPALLYPAVPAPRQRGQIREGLRYIRADRRLSVIMLLALIIGGFGTNWPVMLALMAKTHYQTGATGYGVMFTTLAAGSLLGALVAASIGNPRMRTIVIGGGALGLLLTGAPLLPNYGCFLVALVPMGFFALTYNTAANSSVQLIAPAAMRGRVTAVWVVANNGALPVAGPLMGWSAERFGAPATMATTGVLVVLAVLASATILHRRDPGRTS